jgi:hypothetical protein
MAYALPNVEKFLEDHSRIIPSRERMAILERAQAHAMPSAVLLAGNSAEVWRSTYLEGLFGRKIMNDLTHMEIGLAVLRAV